MNVQQRHPILLLVTVLGLSACNHGPRPQNLVSATTPAGAKVSVLIVGERTPRTGELFAVDDAGIIIRATSERLLLVRWPEVATLYTERLSRDRFGVARKEEVSAEKRAQLALVSRFPHGLEGRLLADVLRALNQETVDEIRPRASTPAPRGEKNDVMTETPSLEAFATTAASAAARYADRRVAMADGYRRIGADFPGMGEHWLRISELVDARLDPERPTMLTYATIDGQPMLVGTGFVVTTRDDERASAAPGWPEAWHEHSGLLGEESGVRPAASTAHHSDGANERRGTRAWVLHIWTAVENPAGRYHADNWALPFARAGLTTGAGVTVDESAGRALSLAVGGDRFLRDLLTDAGFRGEASAASIDSAIALARAEAERVLSDARQMGGAGAGHLASLSATWRTLQDALVVSAGPTVAHYLTSVH